MNWHEADIAQLGDDLQVERGLVEAVEVGVRGGLVDADAPEIGTGVGDVGPVGEEVLGHGELALLDDAAVDRGGGIGVDVDPAGEVAGPDVSCSGHLLFGGRQRGGLRIRRPNSPVLAVIIHLAGLIAEELLLVQVLRVEIRAETNELGLLVGRVDQAVAAVVAHSLHWHVALDTAILRRLARGDFDDEPVEVLHEVALTGAAEAGRRGCEADSGLAGGGGVDLSGCLKESDMISII